MASADAGDAGGIGIAGSRGPQCGKLGSLWVPLVVLFGALVGFAVPISDGSEKEPQPWARISAVLGWSYFFAWSVSFYPQVFQNRKRRSVVGLSLDFQLLNAVGFGCYSVFNGTLFWSPLVREEYRAAHDGHDNAVKLNDVVFAIHASVITCVTLVQVAMYYDYPPADPSERFLRRAVLAGIALVLLAGTGGAVIVGATHERVASWLVYINVLSEVKVVISVVKYCPQVWMNHRRKNTDGWNINNVLLDFSGGLLSVAQLLLDAWAQNDWSAISGDPVKLLLGNISMAFDLVFMAQHYCLYGGRQRGAAGEARAGSRDASLLAAT